MKQWIITVKSLTKNHHFYDKEIAGEYIVDNKITEEKALDRFHGIIPIKILEDFNISVKEKKYDKEKDN